MRLCFAFLLIAAASPSWADEPEWRFPTDRITSDEWAQFKDEVLAKPGLQGQEFNNQLVLISNAEYRLWVFTEPGHPAHPAVVIRIIQPTPDGGSSIDRQGHYAGDEAAFDTWWHQFDALDA